MEEKIPVNDGGGFLDNEGLIKSLVVDLNDLMKSMAAGQYIKFANIAVQMSQKLFNLKDGVAKEKECYEEQLRDLRRLNNELAEKAFGKIGGAGDGSAEDPEEGKGI